MNGDVNSNPFKHYHKFHFYLGYEYIEKLKTTTKGGAGRILDYGCGDGQFISTLITKSKKLYGFDVDSGKIKIAKKLYPSINFNSRKINGSLPYKSDFFDAVLFFHTLEHVDSEIDAINEIFRVLKSGGLLYMASPYQGLFSFFDLANLRYKYPTLHKMLYESLIGKKEYTDNFITVKKGELYGDCSSNRNWHKHYREKEIKRLLENKFRVQLLMKYSLISYLLLLPYNLYHMLFKKESKLFNFLIWLDGKIKLGDLSTNFFLIATKK